MSVRIIIVGTGTGVGKTHVACALLRAWTARGEAVAGLKPVETGVRPAWAASGPPMAGGERRDRAARAASSTSGSPGGDLARRAKGDRAWGLVEGSTGRTSEGAPLEIGWAGASEVGFPAAQVCATTTDQERLWRAAQPGVHEPTFHVKQDSAFHVKRSLYAFEEPVSPHLAAERAGIRIDLAAVRRWVHEHSRPSTIVETAGGLFTPLDQRTTNLDLVAALLPARVLLVAPDRLGVLHDVTATLGFARALRRAPEGLVLSAPEFPDASTGQNAAALASLGIAAPLASFPRTPDDDPSSLACAHQVLEWLTHSTGSLERP